MSTNLNTSTSNSREVKDVHITSFSGGQLGQMIQMHNGHGMDAQIIQMTEAQVKQTMATMAAWLAER